MHVLQVSFISKVRHTTHYNINSWHKAYSQGSATTRNTRYILGSCSNLMTMLLTLAEVQLC